MVISFYGDFRQILQIIVKGTRSQIVASSLKNSSLWEHIHVLPLTINMHRSISEHTHVSAITQSQRWIKISEEDDKSANFKI